MNLNIEKSMTNRSEEMEREPGGRTEKQDECTEESVNGYYMQRVEQVRNLKMETQEVALRFSWYPVCSLEA